MNSFNGCSAMVTGASSGIGEAFAHELAGSGANLILTARSTDKLESLQEALSKKPGVQVDIFSTDLSVPDAAKALFHEVQNRNLTVDLLVNNAGFGKWGKFLDFDPECYRDMLTLNVNALVDLTHLFLPEMLRMGDGGIINVGSTASYVPIPYSAVYGASKAFVLMFSEALYGELADSGVHVMALCPGGTDSNFAEVANSAVNTTGMNLDTPESVAKYGLEQFSLGTPSCIPGRHNRSAAILPRLLKRKRVIETVKKKWVESLKARGLDVA